MVTMKNSFAFACMALLLAFCVGQAWVGDARSDRDLTDGEMARIHGRQPEPVTKDADCVGCYTFHGTKPECKGTNPCNWCVVNGPEGIGKACGALEKIHSGDTQTRKTAVTEYNDYIHVDASRPCWAIYQCITEPPVDEVRCENSTGGGCIDDLEWVVTSCYDCSQGDLIHSESKTWNGCDYCPP